MNFSIHKIEQKKLTFESFLVEFLEEAQKMSSFAIRKLD